MSRDDVRSIFVGLDDAKIVEILALSPRLTDLEEAAIWVAGDGDILAKSGHPLAGAVADIVAILSSAGREPSPAR